MRFSDGEKFDTKGPFRVVRRSDGWYVVGHGTLVPVADQDEGAEMIKLLEGTKGEPPKTN